MSTQTTELIDVTPLNTWIDCSNGTGLAFTERSENYRVWECANPFPPVESQTTDFGMTPSQYAAETYNFVRQNY